MRVKIRATISKVTGTRRTLTQKTKTARKEKWFGDRNEEDTGGNVDESTEYNDDGEWYE